ncbi:Phytosulfokine [Artemisia annua]|uniref:Phytosulfokine n=1 Tax=Artemisia annua TaxID=35608 RepID=A0A2U1P174_ARTAN|nr:Phytosulfokine [Artemisia annua]
MEGLTLRVLVEIDATKGYVEDVDVCYKSLGKYMKLKVEYPWKPPLCDKFKVFGHGCNNCVKNMVNVENTKKNEVNNKKEDVETNKEFSKEVWETVDNRRNTKSAEFKGESNEQKKYGDESDKTQKVDVTEKGKNVIHSQVNGQGSGNMENSNKVESNNRYAVLSDDNDDVGNNLIQLRRDLLVTNEERKKWSNEGREYYKGKVQKGIKSMSVDGLKGKIQNFEKHIAYSNQNIVMSSKAKTDSMVKAAMVEHGLTENQALWERLKPMAKFDDISNNWPTIVSGIANKPANNKVWSVIQRLVLGAAVYFIWQERNVRRAQYIDRSVDCLFQLVVDTVRMKLMGLTMKYSSDVARASEIWQFKVCKNDYYGSSGLLLMLLMKWMVWFSLVSVKSLAAMASIIPLPPPYECVECRRSLSHPGFACGFKVASRIYVMNFDSGIDVKHAIKRRLVGRILWLMKDSSEQ